MKAPKTCEKCGANLDAGEICSCMSEEQAEPVAQGSMEFVMGDSLEKLPATISFNFHQLKAELQNSLADYTGLVVTEDSIKAAKEDRAKLNKLREALEAKRKEVKRECMAPYNDFEAKVKELVGLIDAPIAAIDGQLREFEENRRAKKRAEVLAVYEETVGELRGILPFEKVWIDGWYNVGASMKKIREAIVALEGRVASDLDVLSTVEGEFSDAVKVKYLEALDLNAALAERKRLQDEAEKLRAYNAKQEALKKLEEAAPKTGAPGEIEALVGERKQSGVGEPPAKAGGEGYGASADEEEPEYVPEEPKKYRLAFECKVTIAQAAALQKFLEQSNISYRRI